MHKAENMKANDVLEQKQLKQLYTNVDKEKIAKFMYGHLGLSLVSI